MSTPTHTPSQQRSEEKCRLDYSGKANRVKDYLRATLVVNTIREVRRVWDALDALRVQGKLEIVSIKNRFR